MNPFAVYKNIELMFLQREKERKQKFDNQDIFSEKLIWDKQIATRINRQGVIRDIINIPETDPAEYPLHPDNPKFKLKRKGN